MRNPTFTQTFKMALIAFFVVPTSAFGAVQSQQCRSIFAREAISNSWTRVSIPEQRKQLLDLVKRTDTPAFVKNSKLGPLPVVLVNDATVGKISDFMNHTLGIEMVLQPEDPNSDHGLARIGGFALPQKDEAGAPRLTNLQVDWALPLTRGSAEIHTTGIGWRDLNAMMQKAAIKGNYSKVTVELTYAVTDRQRSDVEYYHRARRAALLAVSTPDWRGDLQPQLADVPNQIPATIYKEDCFDFCRGRSFAPISKFIEVQMTKAGVQDLATYLSAPRVRKFLARARGLVMRADPWKPQDLGPDVVARNKAAMKMAKSILPNRMQGASNVEIASFLNSLVMYDALSKVKVVYEDLGVTADIFARNNFENPRLAAVMIFAPNSETPRFKDASFTARGKFEWSGWGEDGFGTVPFKDQRPLP